MIINHNMMAMNANNNFGRVNKSKAKVTEKLSSGYRINRSADDAAGLAISEKMRAQIRGLNQASRNAQDGISFVQVADGALNEVHALLHRGRELCVQAANDTNIEEDKEAIQKEIDQINKEIDRIARSTEFNTIDIFNHAGSQAGQIAEPVTIINGRLVDINSIVTLAAMDYDKIADASNGKFTAAALRNFAQTLETNVPNIVGSIQAALPDADPALSGGLNIGLQLIYEESNALAYCGSNGTDYSLIINMKYLEKDAGGEIIYSNDLVGTLAHELMHGVMFDMVTNGMLGSGGGDRFPTWFVEGMAQAVGGGIGYLALMPTNGTDEQIGEWLSDMADDSDSYNAYAQGYIGAMYLGYVASGETAVSSNAIADGLNNILKDIADGYSLSQAIYKNSNGKYKDLADFEISIGEDAVQFAKELVKEAGSGRGSIAASSLSAGADVLDDGSAGDFFKLDIVEGGYANNRDAYDAAGVDPYTGGGATTTSGKKADGSINQDAAGKWGTASNGGMADMLLQIGAGSGENMALRRWKMSAKELGIDSVTVTTSENASSGITNFDDAAEKVSKIRTYYGAVQNRLEHTISNLDNSAENLQAAESRIRDADMAEMMVQYSKDNILSQAGQAMLAQANQITQGVLQLLQQ